MWLLRLTAAITEFESMIYRVEIICKTQLEG